MDAATPLLRPSSALTRLLLGACDPRGTFLKYLLSGPDRAKLERHRNRRRYKRPLTIRRSVMLSGRRIFIAAFAATTVMAVPASAETIATAMTPLNIRSGPGPQFSIIGAIPNGGQTTIIGCIRDSLWCQVSYSGRQGW